MRNSLPIWTFLVALGLVGVVHLVALQAFSSHPMAHHPMVDAYTYWDQAKALFEGKDPFEEGYYQPPAYPFLIAMLGKLTGGPSLTVVRVVQVILGVLSAAGLGWVARRRVGDREGLATLVIFGLYPTLILFELDILTPAVSGAALVGALVLLYGGASEDSRGGLRVAGSGLLVGLATAMHPTYLLGGLLLGSRMALEKNFRGLAAFAVCLLLPLMPTTIQNARQFGEFELVSHNAGINFYLGNNPHMRDTAFLRPGLPFRKLALEAEPDHRNVAERDQFWRDRAWAEMAAQPVTTLQVLATKAVWSVNGREIPRNEDYRCRTRVGGPLTFLNLSPVRFALGFALALFGLWERRKEKLVQGWGLLWLALHLPMVLFLVSDRYRLATWPVVALLAGSGLVGLYERVRQRRLGAALWVPLVGLLVSALPIDSRTEMSEAGCRYAEGNLYFEEERWEEARAAYEDVLQVWPDDMGAHSWLAYLAARRQDWPEAIAHGLVVGRQFPGHFPTWRDLAEWQLKAGDREGALISLRAAFSVPGDRTSTGVRIVKLLRAMERNAEAEEFLRQNPSVARHPKVQPGAEP